ncbi:hypothetical protein Ddye_016533 [Dipteronia dyeriana]|uniref:Uncharacterized protein n=1 Tax=Dipteronia dyeriana TaxID=168575 RepID=A0AAD9U7E1_9ROSI|nr:hypothetical protein Ddye_016533 [Dipteronia dyeriana]
MITNNPFPFSVFLGPQLLNLGYNNDDDEDNKEALLMFRANEEQVEDFLKTPKGDWFKGKLTQHDLSEAIARINDVLNLVPEEFVVEDRRRFIASYFGHFMSMHREMKFSGGVIHRLLLRELDHIGPTDEIRILLGNHVVRFSKWRMTYINGTFLEQDEISLEESRVVFRLGEFKEAYDAVKLCLIYMLNWILMRMNERFNIPVW